MASADPGLLLSRLRNERIGSPPEQTDDPGTMLARLRAEELGSQPYSAVPPGIGMLIDLLMAAEPPVTSAIQAVQEPLDQWPFDTPMMPTLTNMGVGGHPVDPNQSIGYGEPITFGDLLRLQLPQSAAELPFELIGPAGDIARHSPDLLAMVKAFHGTRRGAADAIRKTGFDPTKIGTGEGAQAFGFGHYFAENPGVAKSYREVLAGADELGDRPRFIAARALATHDDSPISAMEYLLDSKQGLPAAGTQQIADVDAAIDLLRKGGADLDAGDLLDVSIDVEPEDLLDWDKPLSEQPGIRERWKQFSGEDPYTTGNTPAAYSGEDFYRDLVARGEGIDDLEANASEALREAGIPGLRYLDQGNRDPFGSATRISQRQAAKRIQDLESGEAGMTGKALEQQLALAKKQLEEAEAGITRNIVIFPGGEDLIKQADGAPFGEVVK